MSGPVLNLLRRHSGECVRWGTCFAVVAVVHAGGAMALLANWNSNDLAANPPAIMIDLAPMAVSPTTETTDIPIGQQQAAVEPEPTPPEPEPEPQVEPPPQTDVALEPPPQVELPKPPEPKREKVVEKPKEKPKKKEKKKIATAPTAAPQTAEAQAAPASGAAGRAAIMNWKSQLVSRLERSKRYPSDARSRGDQGVAYLAFTVDRSGGVHGARITRSSGSSALDSETVSLATRVSPLPPPPPEMGGGSIPIVVPIRYSIR